jgi:flagellar capping protein FliD
MSHALLLPNTFQYIQALKKVGFSEPQAQTIVETINSVDQTALATKKDISDLDIRISQLETRLTTNFTMMLLAQAALVVGLIQYLK